MTQSKICYASFEDGKCMRVDDKFDGQGADKRNAKTVAMLTGYGFEVREMPRAEAIAANMQAVS
jgi:hypothetical protein